MKEEKSIRKWIEDLPKHGRITFTIEEAMKEFPHVSVSSIQSSIYRLIAKKRVKSTWRNFYVVIPDEYAIRGRVPPLEYIDSLMYFLGNKYYVGLLSAATLHGSSHQQPQSFMVVVNSNNIRNNKKDDTGISFIAKAKIDDTQLIKKNVTYGEIKVSNPVMTALDLIYHENRVGGLDRVATIISGLIDVIEITNAHEQLMISYPIPVIQRFGFIVDTILGYSNLGDDICNLIKNKGISFRKSYLSPRYKLSSSKELSYNSRWKIIINTDLEIDE